MKRFVCQEMSTDSKLIEVAQGNPEAAVLWPWFILELDDWGRGEYSPVSIKYSRFPAISTITPQKIEEALEAYKCAGLIHVYEVNGTAYMAVNPEAWLRYQTYLCGAKRHTSKSKFPSPTSPPWGEELEQEVFTKMVKPKERGGALSADNSRQTGLSVLPYTTLPYTTLPFPTLPYTTLPKSNNTKPKRAKKSSRKKAQKIEYPEWFEKFWNIYPRREGKRESYAQAVNRVTDLGESTIDKMVEGAKVEAKIFNARPEHDRSVRFIKLPQTFLGFRAHYLERAEMSAEDLRKYMDNVNEPMSPEALDKEKELFEQCGGDLVELERLRNQG